MKGLAPFPELSTTVHGSLCVQIDQDPAKRLVTFLDGRSLTAADIHSGALVFASALQRVGLQPGDRVVVMLDNCEEFLFTFFGCSMAGATIVPLNTALRGQSLSYQLQDAEPVVAVVMDEYLETFVEAIGAISISEVVAVGSSGRFDVQPRVTLYEEFARRRDGDSFQPIVARRRDRCMILYTSGTTGPSKGIVYSHGATLAFADAGARYYAYVPGDVAFSCLPLFHVNALLNVTLGCILHGVPVVLAKRFSVSKFWQQVADARATTTPLLGAMASLLFQRDADEAEQRQHLRAACVVPAPVEFHDELERRFGFRVITVYGLTDAGTITAPPPDETRAGSCGKPLPEWEVCVVDDDDRELGPGEVGELLVRPRFAHITPLGYWRKPEATVAAWQNQWIHTGDYLRYDEDGWFYFVDRKKDAIRSRGENISSFEVEQAALGHPAVAEAAAYAVPSELGEDDVMLAVVFGESGSVAWEDVRDHCRERLPYFAVPRYYRALTSLPHTETGKAKKQPLRADGVTPDSVDLGRLRLSGSSSPLATADDTSACAVDRGRMTYDRADEV